MAKKKNRFQALRDLRAQQQAESAVVPLREQPKEKTKEPDDAKIKSAPVLPVPDTIQPQKEEKPKKKGLGRPPGRRSDPSYTQFSSYIRLELLLSVQDELAQERRKNQQRTARPVCDLIESLLENWLEKQKRKNANA
ncbi:MAG: hypothetical protein AAGC93_21600 [Cyanobacteria bacterium P01_F01_bin.53]